MKRFIYFLFLGDACGDNDEHIQVGDRFIILLSIHENRSNKQIETTNPRLLNKWNTQQK